MRLIDADALPTYDELQRQFSEMRIHKPGLHRSFAQALILYKARIDMTSTVDPVRHGHGVIGVGGFYICSECGAEIIMRQDGYKLYAPKYCSNCGARMDGE